MKAVFKSFSVTIRWIPPKTFIFLKICNWVDMKMNTYLSKSFNGRMHLHNRDMRLLLAGGK